MVSNLPVETLERIFVHSTSHELTTVLRVNRFLYRVATRILYHSISNLTYSQSITCLRSINSSDMLANFVRNLSIDWSSCAEGVMFTSLTSLYHRRHSLMLLDQCLQKLHNLTSLTLLLPPFESRTCGRTLLNNCPFTLSSLTTSLAYDKHLVAFLEQQHSVTTLNLTALRRNFPNLKASALPLLHSFSSIHSSEDSLADILYGRPVERVRLSMSASSSLDTLKVLAQTSIPIKHLTLLGVRGTVMACLHKLKTLIPHVQELYISMREPASYTMSVHPKEFKSLRKLRILTRRAVGSQEGVLYVWRPRYSCEDLQARPVLLDG